MSKRFLTPILSLLIFMLIVPLPVLAQSEYSDEQSDYSGEEYEYFDEIDPVAIALDLVGETELIGSLLLFQFVHSCYDYFSDIDGMIQDLIDARAKMKAGKIALGFKKRSLDAAVSSKRSEGKRAAITVYERERKQGLSKADATQKAIEETQHIKDELDALVAQQEKVNSDIKALEWGIDKVNEMIANLEDLEQCSSEGSEELYELDEELHSEFE